MHKINSRKEIEMKARKLIIVSFVMILASCQDHPKVNEEVGLNSNFITQSRGVYDNDGYVATASDEGIYMIDKGKLKYVDLATLNEVTLTSLSFADDKEIDKQCPDSFKTYCEVADNNFLQFYDNYVFYLAQKTTVEGEITYSLNRLSADGTKRESILSIDTIPSQLVITKGHLFYIDTYSQEIIVTNLNTSDTYKIELPINQDFITFKYSEDYLYLQTYDKNDQSHNFYRYEFLNKELVFMVSKDIQIADGDGNKLLIYVINSWEPLKADLKVVNQDMEVIAEINEDNRLLNYLDSNYIYTSSIDGPQQYKIYDYQGNLIYDISVLNNLKVNDYIRGLNAPMEASQIQGFIGENIFIVGGSDSGLKYFLINLKTGTWHEIFQSVSEDINNG